MLCVSIRPQNEAALIEDFSTARKTCELVEVRIDGFEQIPFDLLQTLMHTPVILSIGQKKDPVLLQKLGSLQPTWLDVPHDIPLFEQLRANVPNVKLICSYHNFEETPQDLKAIRDALKAQKADLIKFVTIAKTGLDGLRMLALLKETKEPMSCFCMGESGSFTRVLAPLFGSKLTYACLPDKPTAPGQLSVQELVDIYGYHRLSQATTPYALVGWPVVQSPSHIVHNANFWRLGMDAVYVKVPLRAHEASWSFRYLQELGFGGISVTHPLKNAFSQEANNSVRWIAGKPCFFNSDGRAMLDAIEEIELIKQKKMILIGAGATAQAIAKEALIRGASLVVTNRTDAKARHLAEQLGCQHAPWNLAHLLSSPYDVLVNATTVGTENEALPIDDGSLRKEAIIADVILQKETPLMRMAQNCGARVVSGREMWLRQAAYQVCFWKEGLVYNEVLTQLRKLL